MASKAKNASRKRWLETLLDTMTAPADAMREHLAEANQNATLGAAAEVGVRNLLRAVVPARVGITSGFLREHEIAEAASPSIVGAEAAGAEVESEGADVSASAPTAEAETARAEEKSEATKVSASTSGVEVEAAAAGEGEAGAARLGVGPPTLSPQTDVLLYDASHAVPLYGIGGIDILSAYDVIGVIEVKDTRRGTGELATKLTKHKDGKGVVIRVEKDRGALEHIDSVRKYAGQALRGVVLFQGNGGSLGSEAQKVKDIVLAEFAEGRTIDVPHFVYCASSPIGEVDKKSGKEVSQGGYLAFYDCCSETVQVVEYANERVAALAGFLRIVTGFLAVKGLVSPAMHLDMRPPRGQPIEPFPFGMGPKPQGLYQLLVARREVTAGAARASVVPTFDKALTDLVNEEKQKEQGVAVRGVAVRAFVSTGRDLDELPTSGFCLEVKTAGKDRLRAFFCLVKPGLFTCAEAGNGDLWQIEVEGESFDDYMRRLLRENGLSEIYERKPDGRRMPSVRADAKSGAEGEP